MFAVKMLFELKGEHFTFDTFILFLCLFHVQKGPFQIIKTPFTDE